MTPFEVNTAVSPSPALRSCDFDFEDHFEIFADRAHYCDPKGGDFPFSACTNEEVEGFFHVLDRDDKAADFILAQCYDCHPGDCSEETPLDVDWSILTPFPSYTSHAPESFKDNRLCIHNDYFPHILRIFRVPHTVTYPVDNSVKRVFYY